MYFVEPAFYLGQSQTTINIGEVQAALSKGRESRKKYERDDYKLKTPLRTESNDRSNNIPMVRLPGKGRLQENRAPMPTASKRKRKGLLAGFLPHLDTSVNEMKEMMRDCGFRDVEEGIVYKNEDRHPNWKISLLVSRSFEIHIFMNERGQLVKVVERPVNWMHSTIADVQDFSTAGSSDSHGLNFDLRILLQTQDVVQENSDLFRFAFPNGHPGEQPILYLDQGKPKLTRVLCERAKAVMGHVRRVDKTDVLTNGTVDAIVFRSRQYNFEKHEITYFGEFNELNLRFNVDNPSHRNSEALAKTVIDPVHQIVYLPP